MDSRPDRVQIWASQLAANDFPPVCAMTGRPAETWRKFRFATPPDWAYALLALVVLGGIGIIAYAIVIASISRRASGYLPLTKRSRLLLNLYMWGTAALFPVFLVLLIAGIVLAGNTDDQALGFVAGTMIVTSVVLLVTFLVLVVLRRWIGPGAKVMEPPIGYYDKPVELRRVHPTFVGAIHQMQATRMAQIARPT